MPSYRHHEPGDLFVHFTVKFPEHIDAAAIPELERALPPRRPLDKFPKSYVVDEVELEEADTRQRQRAEPMDEDEEQPRVQCANQ